TDLLQPAKMNVDGVVQLLQMSLIAKELNVETSTVPRLLDRLARRVDAELNPEFVLEALTLIDEQPPKLGSLIVWLQLSKELSPSPQAAHRFLPHVSKILRDEVSVRELCAAVKSVARDRRLPDEIAWQIRIQRFEKTVGEMKPGQARRFLEMLDRQLPSRARSLEIDRALEEDKEHAITVKELARRILLDRIAAQLGESKDVAAEYVSDIATNVGDRINEQFVLEAISTGEKEPDEI